MTTPGAAGVAKVHLRIQVWRDNTWCYERGQGTPENTGVTKQHRVLQVWPEYP